MIYTSFSGGDSWRNDLWTKPFLLSGFIWSLLFSEMFISSSDSHQTWFTAHQILYHFWQPTPIMPSFLQQRLIGARSQCILHIWNIIHLIFHQVQTLYGKFKVRHFIYKSTSGLRLMFISSTYTIMNGKSMSIGHSFNSIRCRCPKGKPKVMIYLLGAQVICHMSSHNFFVWFCTYLWGWLFMRQAIN